MKHAPLVALAALAFMLSTPASAELAPGAMAPDFTTQGAMAGNDFTFRLSQALKKGPVVLYFYPQAFTPGCTIEAHAFAAAIDDFHKAGATVMGMSEDDLPKLKRFSVSECQKKFPVSIASPQVAKAYDVAAVNPDGSLAGYANRTSYVIGQDGRIKFAHAGRDPLEHVKLTLAAIQGMSPNH